MPDQPNPKTAGDPKVDVARAQDEPKLGSTSKPAKLGDVVLYIPDSFDAVSLAPTGTNVDPFVAIVVHIDEVEEDQGGKTVTVQEADLHVLNKNAANAYLVFDKRAGEGQGCWASRA